MDGALSGGHIVLELVEPFVERTRHIRTRQDVLCTLEKLREAFGFSDAVLLEFTSDMATLVDFLDTNEDRRGRWRKVATLDGLQRSIEVARKFGEKGRVIRFDASQYAPDDPHLKLIDQLDLRESVSVPITYESGVTGSIHFSGASSLTVKQEAGLHLIGYLLFASFRMVQGNDDNSPRASLTPREKEVMILSSQGYTSPEIAEIAGMAERTVNQHIENVAYKFGTKNRLHTVANLLRLNLLD